jgi:hypothetical protein
MTTTREKEAPRLRVRLKAADLIRSLGGTAKIVALAEEHRILGLTTDAIAKWIERDRITLTGLLALDALRRRRAIRYRLHQHIREEKVAA